MGAPAGTTEHHGNVNTTTHHKNNKQQSTTPLSSSSSYKNSKEVERTYASLIQQYLSVLCHDNATFLAERMVSFRPSSRAVYLLSMCHYRSGSFKRARTVLLLHGVSASGRSRGRRRRGEGEERKENTIKEDDEEEEEESIYSAMKYLLAKCCLELKLYGEAEECLLGDCRELFRSSGGGNGNGSRGSGSGGVNGKMNRKDMDQFILDSTPCPIPNGAAGLNLLGTICRRSNRRNRAIDYYRLSLKLDPMMWTSYEALCEMGSTSPDTDDDFIDDPITVFGVFPPALQKIQSFFHYHHHHHHQNDVVMYENQTNDNRGVVGGGSTSSSYRDHLSCSPGGFSVSVTPLGAPPPPGVVLHSHHSILGGGGTNSMDMSSGNVVVGSAPSFAVTPSTPYGGRMIHIDEERVYGEEVEEEDVPLSTVSRSGLPATSLFNAGGGGRGGSTTASRPSGRGSGGSGVQHLPSAALFNTPDLTPIQRWGGENSSRGAGAGAGAGAGTQHFSQHPPSSAKMHPSHYTAGTTTTGPPDSARVASTNSAIARAVAGGGGAGQPPIGRKSTSSYSSTTSGNNVITRARQVAARLYYEPSPECTPPHAYTTSIIPAQMTASLKIARGHRSKRRLGGLALLHDDEDEENSISIMEENTNATETLGLSQSRLSFSSSSVEQSGGVLRYGDAAVNTPGSSIAGTPTPMKGGNLDGKRALFLASTDKGGGAGDDGRGGEDKIDESKIGDGDDNHVVLADSAGGAATYKNNVAFAGAAAAGGSSGDFILEGGDIPREDGGVQIILELLCTLGAAQKLLCQFRCREALQIFHQLPHSQFNTGWVQHQVGRAYFEMADYQNSKRALETMQRVEPHRMKGLEVLSTTLWHLKKEVELSDLAQRAVDFDRMAPESWCVVGNCFSLQKEHETALTFFRRSIQVDPSFTYSHTLSGHEYVSNEDFDKAVSCYRDAIRADGCGRHYNAWYGLGAIYFRQEKYDLAEYHFQKALSINPQSSVLHCHLGMAQHANGKPYEALDTLEGAFRLDPQNAQARYQRATILMSLDRPQQALSELEKVRDAAPREASVHFAMGRVLKRLGRPEQAMRCFLTALDLDPKDNNLIKSAMDRLDEPDVEEDVSAF